MSNKCIKTSEELKWYYEQEKERLQEKGDALEQAFVLGVLSGLHMTDILNEGNFLFLTRHPERSSSKAIRNRVSEYKCLDTQRGGGD